MRIPKYYLDKGRIMTNVDRLDILKIGLKMQKEKLDSQFIVDAMMGGFLVKEINDLCIEWGIYSNNRKDIERKIGERITFLKIRESRSSYV
jgi:hypothetical protein